MEITVLDTATIDKIAAGEVVERPASVVKELVENAVDAMASAITVEIKDGGISFIRVTDNGCGIEATQVKKAFLRHATSKITTVYDLEELKSLGFRGEALSSICAVAKVEMITKTEEALCGIRYLCEGAVEQEISEVGAPKGTTILVRSLFFNTPARRKFLKTPQTEASIIIELMEHIALSRPNISFKLVMNGQIKFNTSGNNNLQEVIYRIFGKETSENLVPIDVLSESIRITGFLGKPVLNRSNRNYENCFINGRYVKCGLLQKALEDGYSNYLMQHKFPFTVLSLNIDTKLVDVNVHPTKMDVRFSNQDSIFSFIATNIQKALQNSEMIPNVIEYDKSEFIIKKQQIPEPFEEKRVKLFHVEEEHHYNIENQSVKTSCLVKNETSNQEPQTTVKDLLMKSEQQTFFEEKLLTENNKEEFQILGQVFDTYWIIAFKEKIFFVDQHAAHEKVKYERLIKQFHEKVITSQAIQPPIIVSLQAKEEEVLKSYLFVFHSLGFEVEEFEGREYAIRQVPTDLYGCNEKELFLDILDELANGPIAKDFSVITDKIASMACKSAVKGNTRMSVTEMKALIDELLTLENPYNCPHGRPTIIAMSKTELEKKFKRIV